MALLRRPDTLMDPRGTTPAKPLVVQASRLPFRASRGAWFFRQAGRLQHIIPSSLP